MVKERDFTVEIVEARSKRPFKEHNADKPFVFLRNGDEYYIRIRSDTKKMTMCSVNIDGRSLGYTVKLGTRASYCGHWSFKGGQSVNRSLKHYHGEGKNQDEYQPGWIDVHFYEALSVGEEHRCDVLPDEGSDLISSRGDLALYKMKRGEQRATFEKGEHLTSVSLGYCSGP